MSHAIEKENVKRQTYKKRNVAFGEIMKSLLWVADLKKKKKKRGKFNEWYAANL